MIDDVPRPVCPGCEEEMVRTAWEDESGEFLCGWICACEYWWGDDENDFDLIIHSATMRAKRAALGISRREEKDVET